MLDRLIELYQHRLLRYLLYLTGNRELAQDLFQETWMRVLERGAQYNGQSKFDTWLFAIARQKIRPARNHVAEHVLDDDGDAVRLFIERMEELFVAHLIESLLAHLLVSAKGRERVVQIMFD